MNLTTATPVEIDTVAAQAHQDRARAQHSIDISIDRIRSYFSASEYVNYRTRYTESAEVCIERALDFVAGGESKPVNTYTTASKVATTLEGIREGQDARRAAQQVLDDVQAEYVARGGWSRFFMVAKGHIHSSMNCSTCNKGNGFTEFGWLPQMSGRTEADCVAEHGALLCTVCFPSAPVEWTNYYEEEAAAKKAARCPGSGQYVELPENMRRRVSKYAECPECHEFFSVTSTWKIRAHKPS